MLPRKLVSISKGKRTRMVIQLNMSWRMAVVNPSLYCSGLLILVRATMMAVRLVPMLEPMMTGMPCCTVMPPDATMATTSEVMVAEDCTRQVEMMPMKRPRAGLVRWAMVSSESSSAWEWSRRKPLCRVVSEHMNRKSETWGMSVHINHNV